MDRQVLQRFRDDLIVLAEGGFPMESAAGEMALLLPPREDPIGPVLVIRIEEVKRGGELHRLVRCFDPDHPHFTRMTGELEYKVICAHEYNRPFVLTYGIPERSNEDVRPVASIRIPSIYDLCDFFRAQGPGIHTELTQYGLRIRFEQNEDSVDIVFPAGLERSVKMVEQAAIVMQRFQAMRAQEAKERAEQQQRLDLAQSIPISPVAVPMQPQRAEPGPTRDEAPVVAPGPEPEPEPVPATEPEPVLPKYGRKKRDAGTD